MSIQKIYYLPKWLDFVVMLLKCWKEILKLGKILGEFAQIFRFVGNFIEFFGIFWKKIQLFL